MSAPFSEKRKYKILIADDNEMNRELLSDFLSDRYDITEVEDGEQCLQELGANINDYSLLLLDLNMPNKNGFDVLAEMNRRHWIEILPVIVISSETEPSIIHRTYDYGVTDFIAKPFDNVVVNRRISNTMKQYVSQHRLINMVAEQVAEKENTAALMVAILSHIVEFRNGESGQHVLHVRTLSEMLLRHLVFKTSEYHITQEDIDLIGIASALHDIGKISIPDQVLNKPGRLTPEEFSIMKTHAAIGADMLSSLPFGDNQALIHVAHDICRWHHERWDGKGYPDGLRGDEIPISAQVVSIADVYDALTSERCYKKAYTHDEAISMILAGECGMFNPLLLKCLAEISEKVRWDVLETDDPHASKPTARALTTELMHDAELSNVNRTLNKLQLTQAKLHFALNASPCIIFSYAVRPSMLVLNPEGARVIGLNDTIQDPITYFTQLEEKNGGNTVQKIISAIRSTTPENPQATFDCFLHLNGVIHHFTGIVRSLWSENEYKGAIGQLTETTDTVHLAEKHDGVHLTLSQLSELIYHLSSSCDLVRLIDPSTHRQFRLNEDMELCEDPAPCSSLWNKGQNHCTNCISNHAISQKSKITKFEFKDDQLAIITARYVEVEHHPYALETVQLIANSYLLDANIRRELENTISSSSSKLYRDALTGVYNHRYYQEQIVSTQTVSALCLLEIDHLSEVHRTYGMQAGDLALQAVVYAISACIRSSDTVLRMENNSFSIIFNSIPMDVFAVRLEQIRQRVHQLMIDGCPGLTLSVSIGGAYGPAPIQELLPRANLLLTEAGTKGNTIRMK